MKVKFPVKSIQDKSLQVMNKVNHILNTSDNLLSMLTQQDAIKHTTVHV